MRVVNGEMKASRAVLLVLGLVILAGSPLSRAQEADTAQVEATVTDPTRVGAPMRDALKAQLVRLRSIELKGLVVAGESSGVALLDMKDHGSILVRSNSQFTANVGGLPLRIVVKNVSADGVEIEAPTLTETLVIPGAFGPSQSSRATLPSILRHVEFHTVSLADALCMLSEQCGTNYSSSAEAGKVPVSVFLRNVPAHVVVEEICKSHNLWYRQDEQTGVLRIMTMSEFERDLVSFREEQSDVFTLLYPNVLEVAAVIQNLYGDRVVLSMGRDDITDESRDLAQRFQRFDLINQRSQGLGTLQGLNNSGGIGTTVVSGGAYGSTVWSSDRGTGSGAGATPPAAEFRNLTPEQAQRVQRLITTDNASTNGVPNVLDAYRQRPASILVTVSRRNNMIIVRTSDIRAMEDIRALVRRLDVPTSMVLLEVKVLSVDLSDGFNSVFDYQFNGVASTKGGVGLATAGFTSGEILPPAAGSMTPGGTVLRSGDMTFQVVNEYFRVRMQLLEERGRVTSLATPLLLTANNEVSRLFLGEERPLIRNITGQTLITENTVATTPNTTIEFRPVGTTLLITPNINSDRTVTLRLLQEDSSIHAGGASIPIVVSSGAVQNVSVDVVATKSISGTFVAKDGMAVAIGGLIEEKVSDVRAQVPILGRIPLLGVLFRRETKAKTRNELVIMIRPHVISTPAEGEGISRTLMKDLSVHPALPDVKPTLGTFGPSQPSKTEPGSR